jgi:hypothetical protein
MRVGHLRIQCPLHGDVIWVGHVDCLHGYLIMLFLNIYIFCSISSKCKFCSYFFLLFCIHCVTICPLIARVTNNFCTSLLFLQIFHYLNTKETYDINLLIIYEWISYDNNQSNKYQIRGTQIFIR